MQRDRQQVTRRKTAHLAVALRSPHKLQIPTGLDQAHYLRIDFHHRPSALPSPIIDDGLVPLGHLHDFPAGGGPH
eukprot:4739182-Alexandrium_andersonii.AAC.1